MTFDVELLYNVQYICLGSAKRTGKMVITMKGRPLDMKKDSERIKRAIRIKERLPKDAPVSVIGNPSYFGAKKDGKLWEPPLEY